MLRTGKLALLEPNDPFSDADIKTLTVAQSQTPSAAQDSTPDVKVKVYGQEIGAVHTVQPAFIGFGFVDSDGAIRLKELQAIVTDGLGWTAPTIRSRATKAAVLAALPKHSLFYFNTHGLVTNEHPNRLYAFGAFNSLNPDDHKTAEFTPAEVAASNGQNVYELVFMNACLSADMRDPLSQGQAFATAFNAKAYVGYNGSQSALLDQKFARAFFNGLKKHASVKNAIKAANSLTQLSIKLTTLGDDSIVIDKSPIP